MCSTNKLSSLIVRNYRSVNAPVTDAVNNARCLQRMKRSFWLAFYSVGITNDTARCSSYTVIELKYRHWGERSDGLIATLEKHLIAHFQRSTRGLCLITPSIFTPIERPKAADEERHFPTEWWEFDFESPPPPQTLLFVPAHGGRRDV
ncbi:hypothetical protein CEXT_155971 [Caerostris extrusa]|uniref:Uncharacterized protein n=1 Tax=Caerostris extrusa TaxID=172846 RepID=A0AAV4QDA1_CAEEX|nr:hypothetical protein CEXT_155971 [Caerostris extrusa]